MSPEEFIEDVCKLVAGLQVPVSIRGNPAILGAASEPWQRLLAEANGGFGWTSADALKEAFSKIMEKAP